MLNKYRGTTTYVHVLAELVRAAQYRSVEEVAAQRPTLTAVVVGVQGKPGDGFYVLAKELGKMKGTENEQAFWERELDAVCTAWRRPLPSA